jgi:hypothetical protein
MALILVPHFILPYHQSPYFAWFEFFEPFTNSLLLQEPGRRRGQRLNGTGCCRFVHWRQESEEALQIGKRLAGPFQIHHFGANSGVSVSQLAAQACAA